MNNESDLLESEGEFEGCSRCSGLTLGAGWEFARTDQNDFSTADEIQYQPITVWKRLI